MAHSTHGRHRAPGRHNPVSELTVLASRAGATGVKASAVLAASGGLVAAFALPAAAAPDRAAKTSTSAPAAPAALAAPAISAPSAVSPAKAPAVGVTGIKVVAKPKPKPKPKAEPKAEVAPVAAVVRHEQRTERRSTARSTASSTRTQSTASRSTTRTPVSAPVAAPVTTNVAQSASGVVNIARSLLGIGYIYGGTTTAGFDCSGFTQYVYAKAGVSIPRTASAQQSASTRVSSPRPGDLVFWGSPAYHVGIYTGPDMMIDSPKPGSSTSERHIWGTPSGYGRF